MKLIYDIDSKSDIHVSTELNEATGQEQKKYKIKGIFSTIGSKNRNGRIYPKGIWETEVIKYQDVIKSGSKNTLMEWEHPARTEVDMMESVQKITDLRIEGDYVMGEAVLLDNPKQNQIKSLIENGIKISVSSRGVGSVKNGIVENFKLVTYDLVSDPSDYNQTMNGIMESCPQYSLTEGILDEKTFEIDEKGKIIEVKEAKEIKEEPEHDENCVCEGCLTKQEEKLAKEIKEQEEKLKTLKQKKTLGGIDDDEEEVETQDDSGEQDDSVDESINLKNLGDLDTQSKEKFLESFSAKLKEILV